jgi:hypothetical protein
MLVAPLLVRNTTELTQSGGHDGFKQNLFISASIACIILVFVMKLHLHSLACVTRSLHSTDVHMWILLGFATSIWTFQVFLSAFRDSNETPCRNTGTTWARLGRIYEHLQPWICCIFLLRPRPARYPKTNTSFKFLMSVKWITSEPRLQA